MTPRIPRKPIERDLVDYLARTWPEPLRFELDSDVDRDAQRDFAQLIEAKVIERIEEVGFHPETGASISAAAYQFTPEIMGDVGATPTPHLN